MTYKEAIEIVRINALKLEYELDRTVEEQKRQDAALDMVVKASVKQIPIKYKAIEYEDSDYWIRKVATCVGCDTFFMKWYKYCPNCGQAIDWGKV